MMLNSTAMKTTFLLNGLDVAHTTRAYVEKKVTAVGKLIAQLEHADVDINRDKRGFYRVEVMVYEDGQMYRAEEIAETIEAATDAVEVKLQEQVRDAHKKNRVLERRGARSIKKKTVIDDTARF